MARSRRAGCSTARVRGAADDRGDRRAPPRGPRARAARSWRCCSPTPSARSTRDLLASDFCEDPWLERDLREYFPDRVVERFGHLLAEHPLRRELIAMVNANLVVNSLGPTFVSQLAAERGAEPADVVARLPDRARGHRRRARAGTRSRACRARSTARVVTELMAGVDRLVEAATRWYLAHGRRAGSRSRIAAAEAPFARLIAVLPEIGEDDWREHRARGRRRARSGSGVPGGRRLGARADARADAGARRDRASPSAPAGRSRTSTRAFHALAARLDIVWLLGALDELPQPTRTQRWAVQAVREDCLDALAELARCALRAAADGTATPGRGGRRLPRRAAPR